SRRRGLELAIEPGFCAASSILKARKFQFRPASASAWIGAATSSTSTPSKTRMTARRDRVCTKGPREKRNRSRNGLDMLAIRGLHGTIRNRAASERAAAERRAAAEVVEGPGFRARLHG